jgi:two-component system sensor histidine kinase QseC
MPLNRLSTTVKKRHYRNLEKLEDEKAPLEVNELLLELNNLFDRLDDAHQRERRFVGDAAHELRTPLASLLIHAENAIDDSLIDPDLSQELKEQSQAELQTSLYSMKKGISRMTHLVNQLLALSRTEGQLDKAQFENLDIRLLCHQAISFEEDKFAQKQQTFIKDVCTKSINLKANAPLIQSLLRNIIDNAVRYTPDQGQIKLSCHHDEHKQNVIISIADSGPGVEAELRSRIKERFFRVVGSGQQGSGLGLSIVDKIVQIHNGTWDLDESEWGGLLIEFKFPVSING